jgi:HEAT repeat protein
MLFLREYAGQVLTVLCMALLLAACKPAHRSAEELSMERELSKVAQSDDEQSSKAMQKIIDMGPRAIAPLQKALGSRNDDIRAAAATALGGIEDRRVIDALVPALSDKSPNVRRATAMALAWVGQDIRDSRVISALKDASTDSYWAVRMYAPMAFGWFGDKSCVPYLRRMLKDSHGAVRMAARGALKALEARE